MQIQGSGGQGLNDLCFRSVYMEFFQLCLGFGVLGGLALSYEVGDPE